MHTLHCSRNVMLCPKCDEPVPRSGLEEHNEEFHTDKQCEMCKASVANNKIEDHKVGQFAKAYKTSSSIFSITVFAEEQVSLPSGDLRVLQTRH